MAGYEAQKLISISLGKIAASRVGRAGTSLHKSLLVATVLHKARHVFMEESYSIYYQQQQPRVGVLPSPSPVVVNPSASYHQEQHHYSHPGEYCEYYPPQPNCSNPSSSPVPQGSPVQQESKSQGSTSYDTTANSSSAASTTTTTTTTTTTSSSSSSEPIYQDVTDDEDDDKENQTECSPTYLDLDACSSRTRSASSTTPLGDSSNTTTTTTRKRRRTISDQETQEAVSSILPKKSKKETARSDMELRALPPPTPCYRSDDDDGGDADTECGPDDDDEDEEDSDTESNTMEVEHITSLVSIFSFGGMGSSGGNGTTPGRVGGAPVVRTVSSPDLCSTQANKDPLDVVQRPVLALTV